MPKRKKEHSEEKKLKKKVRKLEKKLEKRRRILSPTPTSSEVSSDPPDHMSEIINMDPCYSPDQIQQDIILDKDTEVDISPDFLSALGYPDNTEDKYGKEVHMEIANRIESILTDGMRKELKEVLLKKYNVPKNVMLLDAPKLNLELESSLSETIKSRDMRIQERQQQLGTVLSAVLNITDDVIRKEHDSFKLVSVLSDVAKLLSDLHYEDTNIRRKLIATHLNKDIVKSLEYCKRDIFLFGEKFNENIKNASAIKKSAMMLLKQNTGSVAGNKSNEQFKKQENFRASPPPRPRQGKQGGGGKYHQRRPQQRPAPKPYQSYHQKRSKFVRQS